MKFSYDWSSFQGKDYIITKLIFKLQKKQKKILQKIAKEILAKRLNNQPKGKSAGCVFKNPKGHFAARLIEECGLKGKIVGGAKISEKHANFIVNFKGAREKDVKKLIILAKKEVKKKFNVSLEEEIVIF